MKITYIFLYNFDKLTSQIATSRSNTIYEKNKLVNEKIYIFLYIAIELYNILSTSRYKKDSKTIYLVYPFSSNWILSVSDILPLNYVD